QASMDLHSASSVVLQVLTQATSQDTAVLKPAEEQLKQWETQPGFYSVLLNIFTNHTLDINVRWLAVLYFKHGIDRYWRRVAPHALSEEEKSTLRAGLITNFNEPINQIATQIAVLIAKVARLDCPRQWPELIPTLVESVKVQDDLRQHRALLTFYHVTKTLASKRLAADRKLFYDLASGIYNFACSLWNHHTDTFLQQVSSGNESAVLSSLERTLLSLKVLRKLTVNGFVEPHKNMEVMGFLHGIFERLKQFLECSRSIGTDNACRDRLEKTIILFTKVPCTEVLFIDIFHEYNQTLTPVLLEMMQTLQGPTNVEDMNALLIKDAVFLNCFLPVDDFEFRTDQFLPYLETMFTLLFQLLQQVTECDTKMHVLHVLSCVIERVNVQGLGADSKNLYPFLLPVIQLSTDVSQPPHVYLLEDGLELWLVTLENSPCVTPELLRIFQNMSPLLELSSENLRTCFKIINGYIFLSSTEFLQTYAVGLCQSFCELLPEITTEGQVQVLKVVESALKVNPVLGPQMFQPILPYVFRGVIEGEMDQLLGNVIEMWVDRVDNITQPERKKLSALALLSLLPSDNSVIQDKFCGIINISVEALHDVMTEDPETRTYKDCMLMSHHEEPKVTEDEEPPTEQDKRKKMLALKDPVHTVSLQQFIYEKLKAQQEMLGEQGFQSLMETVDTEIVTQLQEFLQGF
ncbi:Importin-11, partial [Cricetulus griseus]